MAIRDPKKQAVQAGLLTGYTSEYTALTDTAKAMAKARRESSPLAMHKLPGLISNFTAYADDCMNKRKPMTWAGFAMAGDISGDTLKRMRNGELDHIVEEYRIIHDIPPDATSWFDEEHNVEIPLIPYSSIAQKAGLLIQNQLEENCYQLKGNQVGSIFGLKAKFGWQDDSGYTTTNNTLIVADRDKALQVLGMLSPSNSNG